MVGSPQAHDLASGEGSVDSGRGAWYLGSILVACFVSSVGVHGPAHPLGRSRSPEPGGRASPPAWRFSAHALEENRGQVRGPVQIVARARGFIGLLSAREATLVVPPATDGAAERPPGNRGPADCLRIRFRGAMVTGRLGGRTRLPGVSNFLIGNDPAGWVTGVRRFSDASAPGLYPGVDLRWSCDPAGILSYDFRVRPGTDPSSIRIAFEGARGIEIDGTGALAIPMDSGTFRHSPPRAFQSIDGSLREVECFFRIHEDGVASFLCPKYDASRPLVIDPSITFSSYAGGTDLDLGSAGVVSGPGGSVFVSGETFSSNSYPTLNAYQSGLRGTSDMVVTRFAADGTLVYSTYLGSGQFDKPGALGVDAAGAAYVVGATGSSSTNYPLKTALQPSFGGGNYDAVVTKLHPSGSSLVYSTFLGGSGDDEATAIAVSGDGAVTVCGRTNSTNFPLGSPYQSTVGGDWDAFVTTIDATGSTIGFSTYFGGNNEDRIRGVGTDPEGKIWIGGWTQSTNLPLHLSLQETRLGTTDAFVARLNPTLGTLLFATYLGGTGNDRCEGLALDATGAVYVAGLTASLNFPTVNPFQAQSGGGTRDAFVARLARDGSAYEYATYLGGTGQEQAYAVSVNGAGECVVGGGTNSTNFPTVAPLQAQRAGLEDGFIARFHQSGSSLLFSTYLGGAANDSVRGVSVEDRQAAVGGNTASTDFPTAAAHQDSKAGSTGDEDVFAARIDIGRGAPLPPSDLSGWLVTLTAVEIRWADPGDDETGITVERRTGQGAFAVIAILGPNTLGYVDSGLTPDTEFIYRVRAFNQDRESLPTSEVAIATPPTPLTPPAAPSGLEASVVSAYQVDLTWSDNSDNEEFFLVSRAIGAGSFSTRATPSIGTTSFADTTVLPDRMYSWKVRAANPIGSSLDTNTVSVTLPSTLQVVLVKGKVADKASPGRDAVSLSATLAFGAGAQIGTFDPASQGLSVRLGDFDDGPFLSLAGGVEGWRLRKGKWTWASPKGSLSKVRVILDPETGALSVKAKRLSLAEPALSNPLRVSISLGTDAGHLDADWQPLRKVGYWKYPVPLLR